MRSALSISRCTKRANSGGGITIGSAPRRAKRSRTSGALTARPRSRAICSASGAGGSGKHGDAAVIPPRGFTLSIMYVEPGQGNAAHTHEVEEVFFVLQGTLTAFIQDENGRRIDIKLGPWECIACPPGVIHGYVNESLEPVYFQVMLGKPRPETMGYADDKLYQRRDAHLQEK